MKKEGEQTYIDALLTEIDAADENSFPPTEKIETGETEIGIVADTRLRKVYSLSRYYGREVERAKVDGQYASGKNAEELELFADQCQNKFSCTVHLFWSAMADEFETWGKLIGIRVGWKIVLRSAKESENPLRRLLGLQ